MNVCFFIAFILAISTTIYSTSEYAPLSGGTVQLLSNWTSAAPFLVFCIIGTIAGILRLSTFACANWSLIKTKNKFTIVAFVLLITFCICSIMACVSLALLPIVNDGGQLTTYMLGWQKRAVPVATSALSLVFAGANECMSWLLFDKISVSIYAI